MNRTVTTASVLAILFGALSTHSSFADCRLRYAKTIAVEKDQYHVSNPSVLLFLPAWGTVAAVEGGKAARRTKALELIDESVAGDGPVLRKTLQALQKKDPDLTLEDVAALVSQYNDKGYFCEGFDTMTYHQIKKFLEAEIQKN